MEVPATILEALKCTHCRGYLSRGPVYLQHDGAASCGRCSTPERPAVRNAQYEATAAMLKFPCKYQELGCPETVPFAAEDDIVSHEEICEHRQFVCPVLGSDRCEWLGTRSELVQHCQDEHPHAYVTNPTDLIHDISKSNLQTFLLSAFQVLFLLHTKVCVVSGKIYHSIRFLGTSEDATNFYFTLDIKRNDEHISKKGKVAPQGCLAIQEDTSLAVDTNSLLSMLDGFDGTTFTVTVMRYCETCANCGAKMAVYRYRDNLGWLCERCAPAKRACVYQDQGCTYTDIDIKCEKHKYLCQYHTRCPILQCNQNVSGGLIKHYASVHKNITYECGSTWQVVQNSMCDHVFLEGIAGTMLCFYDTYHSIFAFSLYTSIPSERLSEYRCVVRLTDPKSGQVLTYTPDAVYNVSQDWHFEVESEKLESWSYQYNVCVDFTKLES